ncbi:E3 ubiquitin protein ligase ORTHRUS 2-like protein [Tanacetum coccineum]
MICKLIPPSQQTLTCKTCATPWHLTCLSSPPLTLSEWDCPDCNSDLFPSHAPFHAPPVEGTLTGAIRAIECDVSLSEMEKARRRQRLLSGAGNEIGGGDDVAGKDVAGSSSSGSDVLKLLSGSFNCSFCMQLPERPVTCDLRFTPVSSQKAPDMND